MRNRKEMNNVNMTMKKTGSLSVKRICCECGNRIKTEEFRTIFGNNKIFYVCLECDK